LLLLPLLLLRADTRWAVAAQALVLVLRAGQGQPGAGEAGLLQRRTASAGQLVAE